MKKYFHKSIFLFVVCMPGLLFTSFSLGKTKKEKKLRSFLEITGKPFFKEGAGTYKVTLIYLNRPLATLVLPINKEFDFQLEKNVIYSVRIEKEGFLPRLVSINTRMPELYKEHIFYKFLFEVEMFNGGLEKFLDPDDVDFPVAVVSYDEKKDCYDYSRKYTQCAIQRLEEVKRSGEKIAQN